MTALGIALLIVGAALLVAEAHLPTAGVLGLLGVVALGAGGWGALTGVGAAVGLAGAAALGGAPPGRPPPPLFRGQGGGGGGGPPPRGPPGAGGPPRPRAR